MRPAFRAHHGVAQGPGQSRGTQFALGHVVLRAGSHRRQGQFLVLQAAQDHDRDVGSAAAQGVKGIQPQAVGQREVQQDHIELGLDQLIQTAQQRLRRAQREGEVWQFRQVLLDQSDVEGIVLDQQYAKYVIRHPDSSRAHRYGGGRLRGRTIPPRSLSAGPAEVAPGARENGKPTS